MHRLRLAGARAGEIARLSGVSLWRGFLGFYNSDNLTYAASIAYYSLLSLFPFFLLALAILGSATTDDSKRTAVLVFVLQYFPIKIECADVRRTKRSERWAKAIHQHFVFANHNAQMPGYTCTQSGAIERPRSTADIKLNAFNRY